MLALSNIEAMLGFGLIVAVVAIVQGILGVYSVALRSRRERSNQATTTLPSDTVPRPTRRGPSRPTDKPGRKAA